jgi:hypothetical protein
MDYLLRVPLPVFVKLPSFLTELDKDVKLSTFAPVYRFRFRSDDPTGMSMNCITASP